MDHNVDFTPLVVVTLLAVLVPVLLHRVRRVRVPIVVGEIVAGILVGRSALGLIGDELDPWLGFLKLFGFAYLMFLSGLEIDVGLLLRSAPADASTRLQRAVGGPLRAALLSFGITLAAAFACAWWLVDLGLTQDPVIMALVLSTTSLGVVAPVLKERGLIRSPLGQYTLVTAVVGDFVTVTLVSVYVILHTEGLTFELLFVLILLAATFLVYRLAVASRRQSKLRELVDELSHATSQLDTRGALALAVIFIALAQGLGVEVILGAFMAGVIVSLVSADEGSVLRPKLNALGYGFFIPIFFILVGAELDLGALVRAPHGLYVVPVLTLMAFAVKYAAALVFRPLFGWREVAALGTLTSARLSLIVAVAAIGFEIGAIDEATNAGIVLVAVITVIVAPVAFNRLAPRPDEPAPGRVIVAGSTPHARLLALRLRDHGERVTVLTANRRLLEDPTGADIDVVLTATGLPAADRLRAAGIDDARALVTMVEDDEESLRLATAAREEFGLTDVVAHVTNPKTAERFRRRGIRAVDSSISTVVMLDSWVRHPHALSLVTDAEITRSLLDVRLENPSFDGEPLRRVPLPGDALVLMIVREGESIVPRGATLLRRHDLLTLVGSPEAIESAAERFR